MKGDELSRLKKKLSEYEMAFNQLNTEYQALLVRNGETERKKYAFDYVKDLITSGAIAITDTEPSTYMNRLEVLAEKFEDKFVPKESNLVKA